MKWNADTGEFEVEHEAKKDTMKREVGKTIGSAPRAPVTTKGGDEINLSTIFSMLPDHILYDDTEFPRTLPEAEARVLASLAIECIGGDILHKPPYSGYAQWTDAQQRRFRKAEMNIALRLLRIAGKRHPAPETQEHDEGNNLPL